MNSRLNELAERRQALLARSDQNRAGIASIFDGLERKLAVAEVLVATARGLSRYRALVGAAGVFMVFAPRAFRSRLRRAMWLVPLVVGGYRAVKAHGEARDDSPLNDD
ncbi:MAG TPA: hypothetical protein VEC56_01145 [Candidatus Krumholzibacteria bacterium]|nr:hypothetical protein [Candidatus Krumholzibacteria bacterium]